MAEGGKHLAILGAIGTAVALGAFVALSKKSEAATDAPRAPLPPPVEPPIPSEGGWSHADATLSYADTPTEIRFRQGLRYRGRLDAAGFEPAAADLARLGLSQGQVFVLPPKDWPPGVFAKAKTTTRWFEGVWAQASQAVPKPSAIEAVWVTAS